MVLPALPGYSETFLINKINGLIKKGYEVYLLVNRVRLTESNFPPQVKISSMVRVNNVFQICCSMVAILFLKPLRCANFIVLEWKCGRQILHIIKNLIISMHILKHPLDFVHFEFATMGINRENIAKAMDAVSLVSFRGFDIGLYPYKNPGCYDLLWRRVHHIHTISDDLYHKALKLGLSKDTAVTKIQPAIDTNYFHSSAKMKIHAPLRILSIGRLEWKKGFEYLVPALRLLKEKGIDFKCKIIGSGSYREAIQFFIHQSGLNKEIQLVGQLSPKEIKDALEWTDIYIQPSIQEGFCNSTLEAQAMGCLCVVSDAEGLPENVIHDETGWVVKRRSSKNIFNTILKILELSPELRENIGQKAILRIQNNFNLSKQENEFYQLYEKV